MPVSSRPGMSPNASITDAIDDSQGDLTANNDGLDSFDNQDHPPRALMRRQDQWLQHFTLKKERIFPSAFSHQVFLKVLKRKPRKHYDI